MFDREAGISKGFATIVIVAALAIILVILFGYNTFSKNNGDQPKITEYRKEGLPLDTNYRSSQRQRGTESSGKAPPLDISGDQSKALLNVKGLSCSSCIQEIKAALSNIEGIEEILVDISRSTAQIYYNNKTLKEPDRLAQAVTSRGYPATLVKIYSSEDLRKEEAVAAAKSRYYIASVGGWDIARSDLDTQLEHAKKKYSKIYGEGVFSSARGNSLIDSLRAQIASRLIDEGVMMQEITKAGYKLDAGAVEKELQKVIQESGKGVEGFKTALDGSGMTLDYFKKRLETQLLISRYLEERILNGASNDVERQALLRSWFNNAKILAEVSYYDKDLERLVQQLSAQGKCGG
jgi:copper chaperone CopZ